MKILNALKSILWFVLLCWSVSSAAQTMTMPDGTVMPTDATTTTQPDGSVVTATAGSQYTIAGSYNIGDSQSSCVTHNCWILTNTGNGSTAGRTNNTVSFVKVSSGYDGYTLGLGAGGNLWNLPFGTATGGKGIWSMATQFGGPYKSVAVVKTGEFFTLYSDPSCVTAYAIKHYLNGTWTTISGCGFDLSAASGGGLIVIGSDYGLYALNGTSWLRIAGTWTSVAAIDSTHAFAVQGNVLYNVDFSTGSVTAVSGAPTMSASSSAIVFSPDERLYAVTNASAFYVYSYQTPTGAGTWTHLLGAPVMLGGNVSSSLFAQDSAGNLFHYLSVVLSHSTTVSGNYICPPGGCPVGSLHTLTASGNFPHGTATTTSNSVSVAPTTYATVGHFDTSMSCDLLYGDPNSPDCFVNGAAQVVCSMMGGIFSAFENLALYSIQEETAYTKFANMGLRAGGGCVQSGPGLVCSYTVSPICSNTTSPDYRYPGGPPPVAWIRDYDFAAWRSVAACVRVNWSGGHSAWLCQNLVLLTIGTSDLSSGICTYNP